MSPEIEDEIEKIEEEIKTTPYNKATQHHIGKLKAKLSKLKEKLERKGKGTARGGGYAVPKEGDATVGLVGYPSVGKSTLLNELTNAKSKVAPYHFTTLDVIPGVLLYNDAEIQILDLPGLVQGAASGKGRGKEVLSVAREVDLIVMIGDVTRSDISGIARELEGMGVRLNKEPPDINIKRKDRGGLEVASTVTLTEVDKETVKDILREYGYINGTIVIRSDITVDQLIDHLAGNRVYTKAMCVINKIDMPFDGSKEEIIGSNKPWKPIFISVEEGTNLDELKEAMFENLNFIRIFLKPQGEKGDDEPMIVKEGARVKDVCKKLHSDFVDKFRYARIWGPTAKFPKQRVGKDHVLKEGDTLRIIIG